ncbi:MAG: hypothetical protein AMXMBFR7_27350 [Planctomycetota bacterium]
MPAVHRQPFPTSPSPVEEEVPYIHPQIFDTVGVPLFPAGDWEGNGSSGIEEVPSPDFVETRVVSKNFRIGGGDGEVQIRQVLLDAPGDRREHQVAGVVAGAIQQSQRSSTSNAPDQGSQALHNELA